LKKLMLLAAMLAMVLAVAAPAVAQQGGDQYSVNVANAVNNCAQYFEQNQVAVQENDIDQEADQYAAAAQILTAVNDNVYVDDGDVIAEVAGAQYQTQVGNVAAPVQAVNQEGAAAQYCTAIANAFTIQYQNNVSETVDAGTTTGTTAGTTGGTTTGGTSGGTTSGGAAPLPATGGFSLLALGAGALLVGGGLVARRVIR
jgi:hypothetical protein